MSSSFASQKAQMEAAQSQSTSCALPAAGAEAAAAIAAYKKRRRVEEPPFDEATAGGALERRLQLRAAGLNVVYTRELDGLRQMKVRLLNGALLSWRAGSAEAKFIAAGRRSSVSARPSFQMPSSGQRPSWFFAC